MRGVGDMLLSETALKEAYPVESIALRGGERGLV